MGWGLARSGGVTGTEGGGSAARARLTAPGAAPLLRTMAWGGAPLIR